MGILILNSRTSTEGLPVSLLKPQGSLCLGVKAHELVMGAGCGITAGSGHIVNASFQP